jgi:tRNA dimethylallyltransferase
MLTPIVAVVGPTATGKSALGLDLAEAWGGEVISCDSTAVYRGVDIGTDKLPAHLRRGIPHHLLDVVEPTEIYSAARYAADAVAAIRDIGARGRLPILVGGTGFYFQSLTRGLFPGPERDEPLRARLNHIAEVRGVESLHRWLGRVDVESSRRIMPRDLKRLVRALEVYLLTGRSLSDHFANTHSPIAGHPVLTMGVTLPRAVVLERVSRRVEAQFASGLLAEVERLVASGVPEAAHAFSGLVYRQVIEMRHGLRDEAATRALIVQENMRYSRRQRMWFRKEADVRWLSGAGDAGAAREEAHALVRAFLNRPDNP